MNQTNKSNIYFPVYKRIEKEVQDLASAIYFCDDQKGVYSLDIADLLVRCVIEIESIAKDIYREEMKTEPSSPGECITWLEKNWNINKKKVNVISPYFHFNKMSCFIPFDYKNKSDEDYYAAYNAIKHDRVKNINKATVYALVRALGALYLLNLFFMDNRLLLNDDYHGEHIDRTFGSDLFSVEVAPCIDIVMLNSEKDIIPEQCVYRIIRKESEYAFRLTYKNQLGEVKSLSLVKTDRTFQEYIASCVDKGITVDQFWGFAAKSFDKTVEQCKKLIFANFRISEFISVRPYRMNATFWAELNK